MILQKLQQYMIQQQCNTWLFVSGSPTGTRKTRDRFNLDLRGILRYKRSRCYKACIPTRCSLRCTCSISDSGCRLHLINIIYNIKQCSVTTNCLYLQLELSIPLIQKWNNNPPVLIRLMKPPGIRSIHQILGNANTWIYLHLKRKLSFPDITRWHVKSWFSKNKNNSTKYPV